MAATTPNFKPVPVPADLTPEFSAKLSTDINQLSEINSLMSNFAGIPEASTLASYNQLGNLIGGSNIPSFMPSTDFTQIASFASQAASLAGQTPADTTNIINSLQSNFIAGDFNIESLDPFGIFDVGEQLKGILCNFEVPVFQSPSFENMFNFNVNDLEDKFKSLLPKFNASQSFNIEDFLKKTVDAFKQRITSAFENIYKKLFECQS